MRLRKLCSVLQDARTVNFADRSIRGLVMDSRRVRPGCLFAVVPGRRHDGTRFVPDAIAHGATVILSSAKVFVPHDVTLIRVPNVRQALADLCCRFYGYPADFVRTVGITGTNGKTTVAWLVRDVLRAAGHEAALLSTVTRQIGRRRLPAPSTTPESVDLQACFADMVEGGVTHAVMEVSSHALDQERVRGVPFAVAALTNVFDHEHLDYHENFEAYCAAKARLFQALPPGSVAVLNRDDAHYDFFRARVPLGARRLTYGRHPEADVTVRRESTGLEGSAASLLTPAGPCEVRSPLLGEFNVSNLLAGAACALAMGVDLPTLAAGLERFGGAPGRLERVGNGQPYTVLVDYAHNAGGLESVLTTLRPLTRGRLIVVFGAGGERDHTKRPLMGKAAAAHADVAVLTSDNSRSERTVDILRMIQAGMPAHAPRVIEPDRRKAIRKAVAMAQSGDLVLIAGKGHETTQEMDGTCVPFDDREQARHAIRDRDHGTASA